MKMLRSVDMSNCHCRKKWKKKSKSQGWQSNVSGSGRIGCAYTVPHDGPDGLVDGVKLDRCHTKGAKQSTSDALKENDDEHDSHWLKSSLFICFQLYFIQF